MNGDYTKVPLRPGDRWTGARMQQGRVLLDHEWNLNLDAVAQRERLEAFDAIGGAGVRDGTDAFKVSLTTAGDGTPDLQIAAGHIWAGGELAVAPASFLYGGQPGEQALPASGTILVYLDVFEEHVQPAEDAALLDPALQPIDSAARTRAGYRVRWAATAETNGRAAWNALWPTLVAGSSGTLSITPLADAPSGGDPCAPPADPAGSLPDGLFRVEVLDGGDATTARFAWSFDNGASAAALLGPTPLASLADVVVAETPDVAFAQGDLVELSWLGRRADRVAHGPLYTVENASTKQDGVHLQLAPATPTAAPPVGAEGLAVRRWDGQAVGAPSTTVSRRGRDYLTIEPQAGTFVAGDWWGARVRDGGNQIEARTAEPPDGTLHSFVQLAYVDLGAGSVADIRPRFKPLVELTTDVCTVAIDLDTDIDAALAELPGDGGEICFAAGRYELTDTLVFSGRRRVTIHGTGPSTVLVAPQASEAALRFESCTEIELRNLRIAGGSPTPGSGNLDGAVTFVGACVDVRVSDCTITCAGAAASTRTCLTVRSDGADLPDVVLLERNAFEVGDRQTGVLLVDVDECRIVDNRVALDPAAAQAAFGTSGIVVAGSRASVVQVTGNIVRDVAQGIHVALSDSGPAKSIDRTLVAGNHVRVKIPPGYDQARHGVYVGRSNSIQVLGNSARLDPFGVGTFTYGVHVMAPTGPMLLVRDTSLDGFAVGVAITDLPAKLPQQRVWLVEGTMAANGIVAVDAPAAAAVELEHNAPMPPAGKLESIVAAPSSLAPGTDATGTVTLDNPAASGGATITLALSPADSKVLSIPQTVTVPAGATSATFTIGAAAAAVANDVSVVIVASQGADPAGATAVTQQAQVTVLASASTAVGALGLEPKEAQPGQAVHGIVKLTKADPAAVVSLSSSNPSVAAPKVASLTVAQGLEGTFEVVTHPQSTLQKVTFAAAVGSQPPRTAEVVVEPALQLRIAGIRILHVANPTDANPHVWFDSAQPAVSFFPERLIALDYGLFDEAAATPPNAIEIVFQGAAPKLATLDPGSSFLVVPTAPADAAPPVNPQVVGTGDARVVRWVADSLPLAPLGILQTSSSVTYGITLKGGIVAATNGRLLDGELLGFPSGNGADGGDASFSLRVTRSRQRLDIDINRDVILAKTQPGYRPEMELGGGVLTGPDVMIGR